MEDFNIFFNMHGEHALLKNAMLLISKTWKGEDRRSNATKTEQKIKRHGEVAGNSESTSTLSWSNLSTNLSPLFRLKLSRVCTF